MGLFALRVFLPNLIIADVSFIKKIPKTILAPSFLFTLLFTIFLGACRTTVETYFLTFIKNPFKAIWYQTSNGVGAGFLSVRPYFAKPYHSWERGTNKNTNKLIRQFLPKSARLDVIDDEQIQQVEDYLNNRPRKVLGFRTPLDIKSDFWCIAVGG